MSRKFKRTVFAILLLIPLTLLIPNTGFGGGFEPVSPCPSGEFPAFVLPPPYMGNLTVEWVPPDSIFWGGVLIYGELKSVERGRGHKNDIIIKRKDQIVIAIGTSLIPFDQVSFLGLEPANLQFLWGGGYYFNWQSKSFGVSSANDLDYKTETLFTVDVVVMEIQCK
jgi:hypothetical protein